MSTVEKTAECVHQMHRQCEAPAVIRRKGAPSWEVPLMILRCDCSCHGKKSHPPRTP